MKLKYILITLLALLVIAPAYADKHKKCDREKWRKDMREFKLRFLAQEMELRDDQQKQFITLYTQMTEEKEALMKRTCQAVEKIEKLDSPTEADYKAGSEALLRAREQEVAIDRKYDEKFRTFLSAKQIFKMKEAERKFRDKLNEMRHKRPPHRE